MIGAIGAFIGVIITSVIVTPLVNKRNVDAKFHNTIEWRQILFNISTSNAIKRKDLLRLKALVSPLNEDIEDSVVNAFCDAILERYPIDAHYIIVFEKNNKIRHLSRLLLKLNWLKHGSGRNPTKPFYLHLYPNYMKTIFLMERARTLIKSIDKVDVNNNDSVCSSWLKSIFKNIPGIVKVMAANTVLLTILCIIASYLQKMLNSSSFMPLSMIRIANPDFFCHTISLANFDLLPLIKTTFFISLFFYLSDSLIALLNQKMTA